MTHNQSHHGKDSNSHHGRKNQGLHRDWRAWMVVVLMLAAMLMYVLSDDESIQPAGPNGNPTDSPPVEAAP